MDFRDVAAPRGAPTEKLFNELEVDFNQPLSEGPVRRLV